MTLIERIREWDLTGRVCSRMLIFVAQHRPQILMKYINGRAETIALQRTMTILDKEGMAHCAHCPTRFGLRKLNQKWLCSSHYSASKTIAMEVI